MRGSAATAVAGILTGLFIVFIVVVIVFSADDGGGSGDGGGICPSRSGSKLCGYCSEDAALSDNPHAGKCRYCPSGTSCIFTGGDECGELKCRTSTSGGTSGGGTTRQYCNSGYCYSGGYCCPRYARYWCRDGCYDSAGANANGCYTLKATCY